MKIEKKLVDFILDTRFDILPKEPVEVAKAMVLGVIGGTIAGAHAEGSDKLFRLVKEWGGREESTLLIDGAKLAAHNAAFANSAIARALDYEDSMTQGIHVGASVVPAALAIAELRGGCTGKDFLTSIIAGTEVSYRINSPTIYEGFDPTGTCTVFATAGIAGKMLGLDPVKMRNALGLAFNKSGGSFQSNIEGTLAVELIQGFASQNGIVCARLAQEGFTGPANFLEGPYGYFHLFAKDTYDADAVAGQLGERFEITKTHFKKYPSSGPTQAGIDSILRLVSEMGITPENVSDIKLKISPKAYVMVGRRLEMGENPKVAAQFNLSYCVASALLRRSSKLNHFEPESIREPKLAKIMEKIQVMEDAEVGRRDRLAMDLEARTREGRVFHEQLNGPSWFYEGGGRPMTMEDHVAKFNDCIAYANSTGRSLPSANIDRIISIITSLEKCPDVRVLVPLLGLPANS